MQSAAQSKVPAEEEKTKQNPTYTKKVSIQVNDETIFDAEGVATSPRVIDANHESVLEGMLRLRRACQINKIKLDQIENLLFAKEG